MLYYENPESFCNFNWEKNRIEKKEGGRGGGGGSLQATRVQIFLSDKPEKVILFSDEHPSVCSAPEDGRT